MPPLPKLEGVAVDDAEDGGGDIQPPSAKKYRKDDDERVQRAARLIIKSPILSVPQVSELLSIFIFYFTLFII